MDSSSLADLEPNADSRPRPALWPVLALRLFPTNSASFTKLRDLEGAGASKIGSVFLYLLVAAIGAKAEFHKVLDAPALVFIGVLNRFCWRRRPQDRVVW